MSSRFQSGRPTPILAVPIRREVDVVGARQRARQVASILGFNQQDQVRIATSVSEIARNALQYGGGRVEFALAAGARPQVLSITVTDQGPGTSDPNALLSGTDKTAAALIGSRRLMDSFEVESAPDQGTTVRFTKNLPADAPSADVARIASQLASDRPADPDESRVQNRELLELLEALRLRDLELAKRQAELQRLGGELEETNRGVVALYAELDEKAAELRTAAELKSTFLRHASHEFRTPLNSILALAQLLLRRTDGDLSPEQERQVSYIRKAAQELTEIVNDLLDLAKVESGKTEVHLSRIYLAQLFGSLRGVMRPLLLHDAVTLVFDYPPEEFSFESDESKVAQILRNLISNALKFTERGEVRVSSETAEGWLSVSVTDTGIGIAPEDRERIFEEFAQVTHAIQRKVKGTGLGLSLSRKLASLLGGSLKVESRPGEGSRFTLRLPLAQPASADHAEAPGSECVLIIDDDEASRYIARSHFRGTRYQVIEATGGIEGSERARFERPALILLDLIMQDRSGFDVLDDLKAHPATRDIPVLIHTSRSLTESDLERLGNHHAGILSKGGPWPPELQARIRDLLGEPGLFAEPSISGRSPG